MSPFSPHKNQAFVGRDVLLVHSCNMLLCPFVTLGESASSQAQPVHNFPTAGPRFGAGLRTAQGSSPRVGLPGACLVRDPARRLSQAPELAFGLNAPCFDSSDPALGIQKGFSASISDSKPVSKATKPQVHLQLNYSQTSSRAMCSQIRVLLQDT